MATERSGIEWTGGTWNFVRGCRRASPGCANCYAERQAYRFSGPGMPYEGLVELGKDGPRWTGRTRFLPEVLAQPLKWNQPRLIFVDSMSDLFFDGFSDREIAAGLGVMAIAFAHTYQILTKHPDRMRAFFARVSLEDAIAAAVDVGISPPRGFVPRVPTWPLPNVWLGTSVESQGWAETRVPELLDTPAAIRFVSYEPALGPVHFGEWLGEQGYESGGPEGWIATGRGIDWIIVGGESGPGARAFDLAWARSVVAECSMSRVPCFVKQLGAHADDGTEPTGKRRVHEGREQMELQGHRIRLVDKKGGDPAEWPPDLRVRAFPLDTAWARLERREEAAR